jgi:hypothetical protein
MKKLLLSALLLCGAYFSNAQCTIPGYTATGIYDDYSGVTEPGSVSGAGLYFFAGTGTNPGGGQPNCTAFSASADRTTNPGKLSVALNGPYNCYVPFGISFGMGAPGGKKWTIDLTNDKTFTVDATNVSSDTSTIIFRIAIQDSLGNSIDTYATALTLGGGNCDNAYLYTIATPPMAPGATMTLSGTFAGGYQANYGPAGARNPANGTTGTSCALENDIDFAHISTITFTVTNSKQDTPANGYAPFPIGNGTNPLVLIDNLRVGACAALTGINSAAIANNNMTIKPNPASSEVEVSYSGTAGNVTFNVSDVTGKVVKTVVGNGTFSVSDLSKGMYFVTTISDNAPVSVSKLVVE